jgi:hypothetical protein
MPELSSSYSLHSLQYLDVFCCPPILVVGTVLEEGESSKGGVLAETENGENGEVGVEGYSEFVLSTMGVTSILGLPFGGDEKRLMDLFSVIEEGWFLEDGVFDS